MDIMRITVEERKCAGNVVNKILILMIVTFRINVPIVVETIQFIQDLVELETRKRNIESQTPKQYSFPWSKKDSSRL